jgi:peptide/nickel transport system permease protein
MLPYITKRLLIMVPLLFGITLITFTVIHLAPGNPVEVQTEMSLKVSAQAKENLKNSMVWISHCMSSTWTGSEATQIRLASPL